MFRRILSAALIAVSLTGAASAETAQVGWWQITDKNHDEANKNHDYVCKRDQINPSPTSLRARAIKAGSPLSATTETEA